MAAGTKRAERAPKDDVPDADRPALRIQYGALGYRRADDGDIDILLITSRQTKRWIIPKGWPIKGLKPCDSAAQEAFEEAGVRGTISRRPIGRYIYAKRLKAGSKAVPCELQVYALEITKQERRWPELGQREVRWCRSAEAIALVNESQLSEIIVDFVEHCAEAAGRAALSDKPGSRRKTPGGKQ